MPPAHPNTSQRLHNWVNPAHLEGSPKQFSERVTKTILMVVASLLQLKGKGILPHRFVI